MKSEIIKRLLVNSQGAYQLVKLLMLMARLINTYVGTNFSSSSSIWWLIVIIPTKVLVVLLLIYLLITFVRAISFSYCRC